MSNISKVEVNSVKYDIKDAVARRNMNGYVSQTDAVFDGKIRMDGSSVSGELSIALGNDSMVSGDYAVAFGDHTVASGDGAFAVGIHTEAIGDGSFAEGMGKEDPSTHSWTPNLASGEGSHVEGMGNEASGRHSHVEGCENAAAGHAAHTEGCTNSAAPAYSHVEGQNNAAISIAGEGGSTDSGIAAHVEGANNQTAASYSHVEGYGNRIDKLAQYAHVSGFNNIANYANNKVVVGQYNKNNVDDILEIGNGYVDTSGVNDVIVRETPIRLTYDNILDMTLQDARFNVVVNGVNKTFSLIDAAIVDDTLDSTSIHPVQNKVIQEELEKLFQSVSEGKKLISDALTDLGVEVPQPTEEHPEYPTFEQLANCIRSINPGYEVDSKYLFVRTSKYTSQDGEVYPIPIPVEGESDGSFINFYTVND